MERLHLGADGQKLGAPAASRAGTQAKKPPAGRSNASNFRKLRLASQLREPVRRFLTDSCFNSKVTPINDAPQAVPFSAYTQKTLPIIFVL